MKLTSHYRDSLDQPLCEGCAEHSILKVEPQVGKEESPKGYDPLECAVCNNIILLEDEATAKALREQVVGEAYEQEQDMQQLDTAVDPDGLDKEGQAAWNELQRPDALEPLCEGCHRTEAMCICGGVPGDFSDLEQEPNLTELEESLEAGRQMARDEAIFLGGPWS